MTHGYSRGLRGPAAQDATLAAAWLAVLFFESAGGFRTFLLAAIPVVLAWGVATLHFPSRVDIDDAGIAFHHYGLSRLSHRFAWKDLARVRVRRFVVRDRVFLRLEPAPAWRGKYWIVDSIEGFDALVSALEAKARR